jgi:hypothetical protein
LCGCSCGAAKHATAFFWSSGVFNVAAMAATFWIFGSSEKVRLIGSLVLETAALGPVIFSKKMKKNPKWPGTV